MALQDLTMMLPSRLGCPMSQKTPNMGNTGLIEKTRLISAVVTVERLITSRLGFDAPPIDRGLR